MKIKKLLSFTLALSLLLGVLQSGMYSVNAASSKWNGGTSNFIGYTGQGTEENPYYIYTAEQLAYLAKSVSDTTTYTGVYFKLGNDIILNTASLSDYTDSDMTPYLKVWTPIGANCQYSAFNGVFDGAGHTIKGVYTTTGYSGLFAELGSSAVVKNLGVIDSYISDSSLTDAVGGIAAENNGVIQNCYFKNSIAYSNIAGGIAGYNYKKIINCFNQSQIKCKTGVAGGIAANNYSGEIKYSFNEGSISSTSTGKTGGIAGEDSGTVQFCFNSGDVSNRNYYSGGISGYKTSGSVKNCYNEGKVQGGIYIGGICGYTSSRVYDSYNWGAITGTQYAGGIAGYAYAAENCYNVGKVTGQQYYPGAILGSSSVKSSNCYYLTGAGNAYRGDLSREDAAGAMTGLTASELSAQDTYSGFDFENDWKFSASYTYPILRDINSSVDEIENENAKWTDTSGDCTIAFNGEEFIISGDGAMGALSKSNDSPWKDLNQKVIVEDGVTSVGSFYFYNCPNIKEISISSSVKNMGSSAFYGCTGISEVDLPTGLETVGSYAFYNCNGLTAVRFGKSSPWIEEYAFAKCTKLEQLELTDVAATIGNYAFSGCKALTAVNFGTAVIGDYSFEKTVITEVTLPETVELTGAYAFSECTNLVKATVNSETVTIGTFSGCSNLADLVLGDSVKDIADNAFENTAITDLYIPKSVVLFSGSSFRNCKLVNVSVAEENEKYFCVDNCIFEANDLGENDLVLGCNNSIIPLNVPFKAIRSYAFQNCTDLETVTVPNGVGIIDSYAFLNCSNLKVLCLSDDVSFIDEYAFEGCDSLEIVYYCGTEEEWNDIAIDSSNTALLNAEIMYDYKIVISGDIDGDGELNSLDLTNLRIALLSDNIDYSNIDVYDINGDGAIDIIDLVRLKKQIAGL